jgi:hypothetical protein
MAGASVWILVGVAALIGLGLIAVLWRTLSGAREERDDLRDS